MFARTRFFRMRSDALRTRRCTRVCSIHRAWRHMTRRHKRNSIAVMTYPQLRELTGCSTNCSFDFGRRASWSRSQ